MSVRSKSRQQSRTPTPARCAAACVAEARCPATYIGRLTDNLCYRAEIKPRLPPLTLTPSTYRLGWSVSGQSETGHLRVDPQPQSLEPRSRIPSMSGRPGSGMQREVKRFVCPEVRAPPTSQRTKSSRRQNSAPRRVEVEGRELLQRLSSEVFELGGRELAGARGASTQGDLLQRLGAPPPKQQRMPFRMAMQIQAARTKRLKKENEQARESGVVTAKSAGPPKRRRERDSNDVGLGIPRGIVMNARAPAGLKRSRNHR